MMTRWTTRCVKIFSGAALMVATSCMTETDSCVKRGQRVWTPRGWRRIESLRAGDHVYSFDVARQRHVQATILEVRRARKRALALRVEGGLTLRVTAEHPLYDPSRRAYLPAQAALDGALGALLLVQASGQARSLAVLSVRLEEGSDEVFDLVLDHHLHNFIVEGILVHNKSIEPSCLVNAECTCEDGAQGTMTCPQGWSSPGQCSCQGQQDMAKEDMPREDMAQDQGQD